MKSTIFNRLFMTSLFICFIIQTGYSKSNYGIIMCDSVVAEAKTYKLLLDEHVFTIIGRKKITQLESTIQYHSLVQRYCPKSYFETQVAMFPLDMITNYYLSDFVPYDTTFCAEDNKRVENAYCEKFLPTASACRRESCRFLASTRCVMPIPIGTGI